MDHPEVQESFSAPTAPEAHHSPATPSPVPRSRKEGLAKAKQVFEKAKNGVAEAADRVAHGTKRLLSRASAKDPPEIVEQRAAGRQSSWIRRAHKLGDKFKVSKASKSTANEPREDQTLTSPPASSSPMESQPCVQESLPAFLSGRAMSSPPSTLSYSSPHAIPTSSPIAIRTPQKQEQLSLTMEESAATHLPPWAQPPSAFEAVMYCYGLGGAALQARTVDPIRQQPADCHEPMHEDLLAAWPRETYDDLNQLDRNTIKLGIVKNALEDYFLKMTDHHALYRGLDFYKQRYKPLTGPGQHLTLPQTWNDSLQSGQGLVHDLVADTSKVPAQVMLLPVRIEMGSWRNAPVKTVLLVDMRQQDWLPKDQSLKLAYRCKATLERHGIHDVEVEVRAVPSSSWEGKSSPSGSIVSSSQPEHATDTLRELKTACHAYIKTYLTPGPLSLDPELVDEVKKALDSNEFSLVLKDVGTMGLEISSPHARSGTMGPILRLKGNNERPERIVGLTCNHVVMRPLGQGKWPDILESYLRPAPGGKNSQGDDEEGSRDMYLSHPTVLTNLGKAFDPAIERVRVAFEKLTRKAFKFSDDGKGEADQMFVEIQNLERALTDLKALRDKIPQNCCRLGEVFAAGAYGTIIEMPETRTSPPVRFLSDWALVDMEPRYYTATQVELSESPWLAWLNRLNAPSQRILPSDEDTRAAADPKYWANTRVNDPNDSKSHFLRISEVVNTPQPHVSIIVAKHGAITGFAVGKTVGALAVIPRLNPKLDVAPENKYIWSTQLVVVGEEARTPFSKPGDSGSAVINEDGQVVGMLVRGLIPAEPPQANQDKGTVKGKEKAEESDAVKVGESSEIKDARMVRQRVNELVNNIPPLSVQSWLVSRLHDYRDRDLTFVAPIEAVLEDIYNVTGQRAEIA